MYNNKQQNQKNIKEAVKLRIMCMSCKNDRHLVPKTFTPLHYTSLHFTPLVDTSLLLV